MAFEAWRPRRDGRARTRPVPALVETLEGRQLLAYSPLGVSLPDLTVQGYGAPVVAWGGSYAVTLDVINLGATSSVDPFALTAGLAEPGTAASVVSQPTQIDVFLSPSGRLGRRVLIGSINVPALAGNTTTRIDATFNQIPLRPAGFPGTGGDLQLWFAVDSAARSPDLDRTNNTVVSPQSVRVQAPLPDLSAVGLDLPPVVQPGDIVRPNFLVANNGAADASNVGVALIASTDPEFRRDVRVLDTYSVSFLPSLAKGPMSRTVLGDAGIDRPENIALVEGDPITMPNFAPEFYVTVVVDATSQIEEVRDLSPRARRLGLVRHEIPAPVRRIGPPIRGLPPAGVITTPPSSATTNPFPYPSFPVRS